MRRAELASDAAYDRDDYERDEDTLHVRAGGGGGKELLARLGRLFGGGGGGGSVSGTPRKTPVGPGTPRGRPVHTF